MCSHNQAADTAKSIPFPPYERASVVVVMMRKSLQKRHASRSLEEVLSATTGGRRNSTLIVGNGGEDCKFRIHVLTHVHNGRDVTTAIAVVGRRPDRNNIFGLEVVLEPFIDELMRASD